MDDCVCLEVDCVTEDADEDVFGGNLESVRGSVRAGDHASRLRGGRWRRLRLALVGRPRMQPF